MLKRVTRSIFLKYFLTCSLIILSSILVLGTAVTVTAVKYTNGQRQSLYGKNANTIAQYLESIIQMNGSLSNQDLRFLSTVASTTDTSVFIVDSGGKVLAMAYSDRNVQFDIKTAVPAFVLKKVAAQKTYNEVGTLGGTFGKAYNVAGAAFNWADGTDGAVFVFKRADAIENLVGVVFYIFIVCSVIVLALASVVLSFVTSKLVRPLRQMSSAAKSFARGDFSSRITVSGNDEVAELAVAFNNMAASLDSLEEMRRSFVANVSHELKTPMTSIAGFIDGILDGTIPAEKQEHYLRIVSDEVRRLSRLVRSMLDIASLEAGSMKITKTDFDVAEIIRRVLLGFEAPVDQKALDVELSGLDDALMVNADQDIVYRAVYNIIDNAVKFSNENGRIDIRAANRDGRIYIGVRNTGMGIPARDLPYVFDRFYKTDKSRGLDRNGYGLGLYIIKQTLALMGEDITVKSEEGGYCEFVFTLRAA